MKKYTTFNHFMPLLLNLFFFFFFSFFLEHTRVHWQMLTGSLGKTALVCRICQFHNVLSPRVTDFFLPMWCQWMEDQEEMCTVLVSSGQEPAQGTFIRVTFRECLSGKDQNSGPGVVKQLCSWLCLCCTHNIFSLMHIKSLFT